MSVSEEIFDVVNEHDEVVDQLPRAVVHQNKRLHRAVHIFVFNRAGQLYIQKRAPTKDQLPNCWTSSCSGHVDAGEDYDSAAIREIREELDIHLVSAADLNFLYKHDACKRTGWEFVHVYKLRWDGPITFDPVEVSEGQWIEPAALESWIERNRHDFAPSFRLLWSELRQRKLI